MKTEHGVDLTLGERGQVVIPKATRVRLGLKPKMKIHMVEKDGEMKLTPKPDLEAMDAAFERLRGRGRGQLEKFGFKSIEEFLAASRGR